MSAVGFGASSLRCPHELRGWATRSRYSAGYAYMHFQEDSGSESERLRALRANIQCLDWRGFRLGGIADISGEYGQVERASAPMSTRYIFGPQIIVASIELRPLCTFWAAWAHFSGGNFTSRGLAYGIGGGVDFKIPSRFSWRILQADAFPLTWEATTSTARGFRRVSSSISDSRLAGIFHVSFAVNAILISLLSEPKNVFFCQKLASIGALRASNVS